VDRGDPIPDYARYRAEIDFMLAVMDAVRMLPGLDGQPAGDSDFDAVVDGALRAYRAAVPR
jgi:hypothetical protein